VPRSSARYRAGVTQTAETPPLDAARGSGPERASRRPRSLIVSFFGSYGRDIGGWVSVASLIALMAELGVPAPAVRSAVSRLKRRGLLEAERTAGVAGYRLSEAGMRILAEGDRRIFHRKVAQLSDGWVMAVFSVPESQRSKRHELRSRLAWLGFGTVTSGVWVAPAHLTDQARSTVRELGVEPFVELFHAEHLGSDELTAAVEQWWDLPALQRMYQAFLDEHEPVLESWRRRGVAGNGSAAFADHLRAVDAWRRMPFLDPGLPPELLPASWAGSRAARVFFDLHSLLSGPGLAHVRSLAADHGS
jgi:phenylacetic acid degradation operon negative regulatory protein